MKTRKRERKRKMTVSEDAVNTLVKNHLRTVKCPAGSDESYLERDAFEAWDYTAWVNNKEQAQLVNFGTRYSCLRCEWKAVWSYEKHPNGIGRSRHWETIQEPTPPFNEDDYSEDFES